MKFGFCVYDVGPAKNNKIIAQVAKEMGHEVVVVPFQEESAWTKYRDELFLCDLVIGSFSSFKTMSDGTRVPVMEEINLVNALPRNQDRGYLPFVVAEDIPGPALRLNAIPGFEGFKAPLAGAIVAMPGQHEEAVRKGGKGFSYRDVVYLGPPCHWKESYDAMTSGEPISFSHRFLGECYRERVSSRDATVFYIGGKDIFRDNALLEIIVNGWRRLRLFENYQTAFNWDRLVLVFKRHSGEKGALQKEAFKKKAVEAFAWRDEFLKDVWQMELDPSWSVPELIRASMVTVFDGSRTDSIAAAYARTGSSLYYYDEVSIQNIANQGGPGHFFVSTLGGALEVEGLAQFEAGLDLLLTPEGRKWLRVSQEKNFPLPDDWDTAPKIVRYLERLARGEI